MKYEYEERAFLSESDFLRIKKYLDKNAAKVEIDNKRSYYFVLPDRNLSIAVSKSKALIKYKSGQIAKGNGFEEHEFNFNTIQVNEAIGLFSALLEIEPQYSEQFRINYFLNDGIGIALKYTLSWGFHIEIEKVYEAVNGEELSNNKKFAGQDIKEIVKILGITPVTLKDMNAFSKDCAIGKNRGEFSPAAFSKRYGKMFES